MSFDRTHGTDHAAPSAPTAVPTVAGKKARTDRLSAPTGHAPAPTSSAPATGLAGTGWLNGVLGFGGGESEEAEGNVEVETSVSASGSGSGSGESDGGESEGDGDVGDADGDGDDGHTEGDARAEHLDDGTPGATGKTAHTARVDPPIPSGPKPKIRHTTLKRAPNGASNKRATVGVGEAVKFSGSVTGHWSASRGTHSGQGTHFTWTAPDTPGLATITLTTGLRTATRKIRVIAPTQLKMVKASEDSWPKGVQGAGMITNLTLGPTSVCFGNVEWLEVPGGPSQAFGYFTKHKPINHHPNPNWLPWDDQNGGLIDHASLFRWPKPWSPGGFQWDIPNKYRVGSVGGSGHLFLTTHQVFRITDKRGTTTITKQGARVTRTP